VSDPFYGIVVANKVDLVGEAAVGGQMRQWADDHGFDFLITSARTALNVTKLFDMAVTGAAEVTRGFETAIEPARPKKDCC
jgi:50S ribosomal subunit-associated GTPase HflX